MVSAAVSLFMWGRIAWLKCAILKRFDYLQGSMVLLAGCFCFIWLVGVTCVIDEVACVCMVLTVPTASSSVHNQAEAGAEPGGV